MTQTFCFPYFAAVTLYFKSLFLVKVLTERHHQVCVPDVQVQMSFERIGSCVYFLLLLPQRRCVLTSYVTARIGERLIAGDIVSEA